MCQKEREMERVQRCSEQEIDPVSSFTCEGTNDLGESLRAEVALVPASDS